MTPIMLPVFAAMSIDPNPIMILPFVALLGCIAICPLLAADFWSRHYRTVAVGLGLISFLYYCFGLHAGPRMLGVAEDYISFIVFIASLFVTAGGIHIRVRGEATPAVNVGYLAIGAVLANLVGTTGASMLLIRPWIRMNKYRFTSFHTAFFIFLISNVGGCLTPIGDPPLFLGYLKGVPFFWITQRTLPMWLSAVAVLLVIFYFIDRHNFLRAPKEIRDLETANESFRIDGLRNLLFLAVIIGAVVIGPPGIRELLMAAAAIASYKTTSRPIHESNHFSFGPIQEVAWLFLGIFATMVPALDYLELHAGNLGIRDPMLFYWLSGSLSSVLDNAPTYVTFLAAAFGLQGLSLDNAADMRQFLTHHGEYIVAVSLGSVFFGAVTYIGKFSFPILLPVFALIAYLFLRT